MILTTHYHEKAVYITDRIGNMANEELKEVGTAAELMDKKRVKNFEDAFIAIAGEGVATV